MAAVNKCIFIGGLGSDGEYKEVGNDKKVYNNTMAITKKSRGEESTTWINIRAWNKTAELLKRYTRRGSQVYIEGELIVESWDDKNTGKKAYKTVIVVQTMQFISKPSNDDKKQGETAPVATVGNGDGDDFDLAF